MHTAATTSHAALTASPRLSATIANATAPRRATAIHKSFVCGAPELLMILMDVLPDCRSPTNQESPSRGPLSRQIEARVDWPRSFLSVHNRVSIGFYTRVRSH